MTRTLFGVALVSMVAAAVGGAQSKPPARCDITVPPSVHGRPIHGRVYVMITRNGEREPRLQLNQADGIPFFGFIHVLLNWSG